MSEIPTKVAELEVPRIWKSKISHDVFPDVVKGDASLLGILNVDVERRVRTKPEVADAPMRKGRSLVAVRSLGKRRHSSLLRGRQAGGAGSGLQKEGARQRGEAAD